jgi:hypothetical protein
MEAADFCSLHSIRWVYLQALGPLFDKALRVVRVLVEGVHVRVEGVRVPVEGRVRARVQVEGAHLVPRNEVVAEGDRYRTVPVGA